LPDNPFSLVKTEPVSNEYQDFMKWWPEYAQTLNMRATLNWVEIAWAGWFARSEVGEGKLPSIFPRQGPSE
jgi:hypothetical protein